MIRLLNSAVMRFHSSYIKQPSGCWEWQKSLNSGYGQISVDGTPMLAHRLSWIIHKGILPGDLLVCHHCDNRKCVNPDHFFIGTHADNNKDAWNKNRTSPPPIHLGERNNRAKLMTEQVNTIKEKSMPRLALADRFGVTYRTIAGIQRGETRKEG